MYGTVEWLDPEKGYGLIMDEDDNDIFFHYSEVLAEGRELEERDEVEFEVGEAEEGRIATAIHLTDDSSAVERSEEEVEELEEVEEED